MSIDPATLVEITYIIAIIVGILAVCAAAMWIITLIKAPESVSGVLPAAIRAGSLTRLATVLSIVAAVFGLRLLDKISAEAAIAVLSGIAGYILGGERRSSLEEKAEKRAERDSE